jgi:seryl-tRNA synthetase
MFEKRQIVEIAFFMLTLKKINENPEEVIRKLAKKNFDANAIVDQIVELDNKRRSTQVLLDSTLAEINSSFQDSCLLFFCFL